jgi:hypothetical protein
MECYELNATVSAVSREEGGIKCEHLSGNPIQLESAYEPIV